MLRTLVVVAAVLTIALPSRHTAVADDDDGRQLQQSMIWLDSAPFGCEVYAVFRKECQLTTAPKQAILRLFADTRYILWINGQYVERGPCRFVPSHPEYDTIDVTSHLRQGDNAVAILVHHYHDGVMQDDGSEVNGRIARHVPGLTAMLDIVEQDDGLVHLSTDSTWQGSTDTRFGPSGVAPSSIPDRIDARRDSGDWALPGFDDSKWEQPVSVDGGHWGSLGARSIPLLCETEIKPLMLIERAGEAVHESVSDSLPIDLKQGDQLVIDAGQFVQAYSIVDLNAQDGSELELEYTPQFFDSGRQPSGSHGHINQYIAREGRQNYMSGDTFGCKYLVIRLKSGQAKLYGVRLVNRLYPFEVVGGFQSNDAMLNHLWQIGVNTMRLCSEDAYVDCAGRERAAWLGDGVVIEAPITRVALAGREPDGTLRYADPRLLRQKLWQVGNCVLPDGRVKAFAPSDGCDIHGYIEDYACLWIQGIRTYSDMTGELDLARELWPTVTRQLQWFIDRLSPRGLVNAREFVFIGNPLAYQACEGATLNAYLYRALVDAAELARLLEKTDENQQYQAAAEMLKQAINAHLWDDEAGAYYGGIQNGQKTDLTAYAAMMCLYFDVVPQERKDRVNEWFLANYQKEDFSPYAYTFLFDVLYRMDTATADRLVLDLMRQRWAKMAAGETQTVWEGFEAAEVCHIMGSTPTYHLSRHVLGVRVDGPVGNRRILVEPRLGDLRRAEGTVVTEFGPVPVSWNKADGEMGLAFSMEVPANVKAEVRLPVASKTPSLVLDGQTINMTVDSKMRQRGRCVVLELGPGRHAGVVTSGTASEERAGVVDAARDLGSPPEDATMSQVRIIRLDNQRQFADLKTAFEADNPSLRLTLVTVDGEDILRSEHGGMRVFWVYRGNGEVLLPKGYRTQEGDGSTLPLEYTPDKIDPAFADTIRLVNERLASVTPAVAVPVRRIIGRLKNDVFIGNYVGDLWTLEHTARPWSSDSQVEAALASLFHLYREHGFSTKQTDSYEPVIAGDQLIASAQHDVRVRGQFQCLALENVGRSKSHESTARRLRYLLDTAGGCNPDFDPFRRLPLTWYTNYPGEACDGPNWVNSHIVNIPKETSPTHFHPPKAVGGTIPQREMYLVLEPQTYKLDTWGRTASLIVYPDLRDLMRYDEYRLEPGMFVYIPPGCGHRGLDVFVNVLTIPGFRPHNEYYIDRDIRDLTDGKSPYNTNLLDGKNYKRIEDLL